MAAMRANAVNAATCVPRFPSHVRQSGPTGWTRACNYWNSPALLSIGSTKQHGLDEKGRPE
jgi:hypothetical protein